MRAGIIAGVALATLAVLGVAATAAGPVTQETTTMKKLTPILVVDAIEPCLPFWTERLGFDKTAEVPDGDRLGFVILARDGVEVMYQTRRGIAADAPSVAESGAGSKSLLFLEVGDVGDVARRLEGVEVVVPKRKTFYGATEIFYRAPCGTVVGFAEFGQDG
jgi:uncharacterized glyoxalase superfamily protein PhnB